MEQKRLLIYTIYDKQDYISSYILTVLKAMKQFVSDIIVVINSNNNAVIQIDKLQIITNKIIIRDNIGFDIWGYKTGLIYYEKKYYEQFDEIILMNDTLLGPLYPLDKMFHTMSNKDIDFWGLTLFHKTPFDPFGTIKYGYIPTHIQSSFMVFKQHFYNTDDFYSYWNSLPAFKTYKEAVGQHECIFTKHFEDLGYKWDVYIDTRREDNYTYYPLLHNPVKVLKEYKCPFFKRRSFFHNYNDYLEYSNGNQAHELLKFIENETKYNTDLIWSNILRTCSLIDIYRCLNLNYISYSCNESIKKNIGIFVYIDNETYINMLDEYLSKIPEHITVNILAHSYIDTRRFDCKYNKVIINSDIGIYSWIKMEEDVMKYDIVCFIHNKPLLNSYIQIKEDKFLEINYKNLLNNINYTANLFEKNKYLGVLLPQEIYFGEYFKNINTIIPDEEYNKILELKNTMNLSELNINKENDLACESGMFWCRPEALHGIFSPLIDSDNYYLIKYIITANAQKNGYFTGKINDIDVAQTDMISYQYMFHNTINALSNKMQVNTSYNGMLYNINTINNHIVENNTGKKPNIIQKFIKKIAGA